MREQRSQRGCTQTPGPFASEPEERHVKGDPAFGGCDQKEKQKDAFVPGTGPWKRLIIYKDGRGGTGKAGTGEAAREANTLLSGSHRGNSWFVDYCGLASINFLAFVIISDYLHLFVKLSS